MGIFKTSRACGLAIVVIAFASSGVQAQSGAGTGVAPSTTLATLLPIGAANVEVMEVVAHPRLVGLMTKLQAAARQDPAWWAAYVQSAPAGQPRAYDARMGLTEGEYKALLALGDSVSLRKATTTTLTVRSVQGGWRLGGGPTLPELDGIEIDTVTGVVRTPFGSARSPRTIQPNPNQHTTGLWAGVEWKGEDVLPAGDAGTVVTFAVGRLVTSGRTLLYYDAKRVRGGQVVARAARILTMAPRP